MRGESRRDQNRREMKYADAKERADKRAKERELTWLNKVEGANFLRFDKSKVYRLDFLPYQAGAMNKLCREGFWTYELTYYLHKVPVPDGIRKYCCLFKTFDKRCPICDDLIAARRNGRLDKKALQDLGYKEQQLFNVIDLDDKKAGVQILDFNQFQLGKLIDDKMTKKDRYAKFFALQGGFTLEISIEKGSYNNNPTYKPISIDFEPRADYDDSILDKVFNLELFPKELSFEELQKVWEQSSEGGDGHGADDDDAPHGTGGRARDDDDDDDDEPSTRSQKAKVKPDSDDDDAPPPQQQQKVEESPPKEKSKAKPKAATVPKWQVGDLVEYAGTEYKIVKIKDDGTLILEDEDDDREKVAPDKVRPVKTADAAPSDDGDDKPAAPSASGKRADDDDDDLDDDDDDDD